MKERVKVCYIANDATEWVSEFNCREHEAKLKNLTYLCPHCNGRGTQHGEPIFTRVVDPDDVACGGDYWGLGKDVPTGGYKQVSCEVCDGHGWTATEKWQVTAKKATE